MPAIAVNVNSGAGDFPAKVTMQVIVCTIIAAFGGLMFGYDIGISGGVTAMDDFLLKFFPHVYVKKHHAKENNYCKFDDEYLQLFTSSLYLAAIVACLFASMFLKTFGRKPTIQLASVFFVFGAILNATAINLAMLIVGRMLLGAGVGFGNQAVPLFISELAPAKHRGALNISFQLLITVGIFIASLINYFTSKIHPYGWRISLGGAAIPALILLIGSLIIVETPGSLIERGKQDKALKTLRKIRGVEDVDREFQEIIEATKQAKLVKHSYYKLLMERENRPPLICGTIIHVFQQFTGINVVMFYAPVLFQTMGSSSDASLWSTVVQNTVNLVATGVAILSVDKLGRRVLLLEGAAQMLLTQCVIGGLLAWQLKVTGSVPEIYSIILLVLICIFVSGFAWSWGPLGWLISSEVYPRDVRSAGFFCAVSTNMLCTFIIAQVFLSMLCRMRSGIFFFFAAFILVMGLFVYFMLPETKGVPIDEISERVWKKHWFWKRYYEDDAPAEQRQPV